MKTNPQDGDRLLAGYLSEQQLADQLDIGLRTLRTWRKERLGPPVTMVGRRRMFRIEAVQAWLQSREQKMPREGSRQAAKEHRAA